MLQITDPKYKAGALEDIAELNLESAMVKDAVTNTMYFMKWRTQQYIISKFGLSKEDVEEYLNGK